MSIYATLWTLQFPRFGDDHDGCEWIEVFAQAVPVYVGDPNNPSYADGDPYGSFLPTRVSRGDDDRRARAVVFVTPLTRKGTDRSGQEYEAPLLVLSGEEYEAIKFEELHRRLCDALRDAQSSVG